MEQQKPRQDNFTKRFDTIFAFLILEIIALASFGIGGALGIRLLQIIGFFLSLFSIPFIQNNYSKQDLKPNLPWLIPLGLFCLLMGFSAFFFRHSRAYSRRFSFCSSVSVFRYSLTYWARASFAAFVRISTV